MSRPAIMLIDLLSADISVTNVNSPHYDVEQERWWFLGHRTNRKLLRI